MVLYLASDDPLPTIPWDEAQPAFHVCRLSDCGMGGDVIVQFKRSKVYFVGSDQWCGCGFGASSEQGVRCLRDLRDFLRTATAQSGIVEMHSCWTGAEGAEREEKFVITPDDILDPEFRFGEQEYHLVYSDSDRASSAQEEAKAERETFRED